MTGELCGRLGDEIDQAAWCAGILMTSMPFWNLTPWTTQLVAFHEQTIEPFGFGNVPNLLGRVRPIEQLIGILPCAINGEHELAGLRRAWAILIGLTVMAITVGVLTMVIHDRIRLASERR